MHDQRVRPGVGQLVAVEPEEMEILADRGHERAVHALGLEPEHHDDVAAIEAGPQVMVDLDAEALGRRRQQRRRCNEANMRPHDVEQLDVRARDAAVRDVADDDDAAASHVAQVPAPRVEVEQRLCRVLMGTVASVDDRDVEPLSNALGSASCAMSDNHQVRSHGFNRESGVLERLTLGERRGTRREGHRVGR